MRRPEASWDTRRFRDLVLDAFGEAPASKAFAVSQALVRDCQFAAYHAQQAYRLMEDVEYPAGSLEESRGLAALRQMAAEAEPGEIDRPLARARFEATAHTLASLRSLHSATDLSGPLVHSALNLKERFPGLLKENRIYPPTVKDALARESVHPRIVQALQSVLDSEPYVYLKDLVVTLKHRTLVPAGFSVAYDLRPEPRHGIRIGAFERGRTTYEACWANDYLESGMKTVVSLMIGLGHALDAELLSLRTVAGSDGI